MTRIADTLTDTAVLGELGSRVAGARIRADFSQADLAQEAGVSLAAVRRLEAGQPVSSDRLVRVLRALRLLSGLEQVVPDRGPSPLEMIDRAGERRQRVRKPATAKRDGPWTWGDE